jgi:hypothetical protein
MVCHEGSSRVAVRRRIGTPIRDEDDGRKHKEAESHVQKKIVASRIAAQAEESEHQTHEAVKSRDHIPGSSCGFLHSHAAQDQSVCRFGQLFVRASAGKAVLKIGGTGMADALLAHLARTHSLDVRMIEAAHI